MTLIRGIETTYRGIHMRSRLEAKWANMFDQFGWRWEYEPFDTNGWIPDFLIYGSPNPLLVEVKPMLEFDSDVRRKIENAIELKDEIDWAPDKFGILVVGGALLDISKINDMSYSIGWIFDSWQCAGMGPWDHAVLIYPTLHPLQYGVAACLGSYQDRISGVHEGDHYMRPVARHEMNDMWTNATNAVQWMPKPQ